jgi:hypothetical protein
MQDFTKQAILYFFLLIPTLFAFVVMGQGIIKIQKKEKNASMEVGFGIFLLILISATYLLFIR